MAGWIVVAAGYLVGLRSPGAIAAAGFVLCLLAMPETAACGARPADVTNATLLEPTREYAALTSVLSANSLRGRPLRWLCTLTNGAIIGTASDIKP
ncbi:hypothetical protein MSAS_16670 [Mycobacterium saskatchewanense]|nr:hypothetical protein MSAS_16670 [Mycobacterium saskatchewanense]